VLFRDLDFIITTEGELAWAPVVIQPLHSIGLDVIAEALEELRLHALEAHVLGGSRLLDFDYGRLERQLSAFLRPRPSWEDLCHLTFLFTNILAQLTGGESLSLEYLIRSAPTEHPFGLRNVAETVGHLVAPRIPPSPMNDEFVGVTEYVVESFHDLLVGETDSPFSSDSSRGSHHPSHECFMAGTFKGHVESVREEEAPPTNDLSDEVEGDVGAPPHLWVEQLKAWHRELEEA